MLPVFSNFCERASPQQSKLASLDIFAKTDDDNSNGVYLSFIENAPTLCIGDCKKCNVQPTGHQSFVFQTKTLDLTMECLKEKGGSLSEAIRYDWGTYEIRLSDIDENEIVIVEFV